MSQIMVFASGGGGNFRAVCEHFKNSEHQIVGLAVDRDCGAEQVASDYDINVFKLRATKSKGLIVQDLELLPTSDLVALCGFRRIIPSAYLESIASTPVINTHPSLLPAYGGKGMIGENVQKLVISNEEKYAGCTIHFVDSGIDTGKHIIQCRTLVDQNETAWELGGRVHQLETKLLPIAIELVLKGVS